MSNYDAPVSAPANSDQSPIHPGLRAHTKPSITVITIIYSQVTKRDDVRNCVDFIGSHLCDDFYLENETHKLVVVDNLCTGSFENITHIRMPVSTGNLISLDPELVGEVLDTMPIPSIEPLMVAAVSWHGWSRLGGQRSPVTSGPARPTVIERSIGSDTRRLKVGRFND